MIKKKIIITILLMTAIISACYLSVSLVKTGLEVDGGQDEISINILSAPKSSGHVVSELWNDTMNEVSCVAVSADGKYMAVVTEDNLVNSERLLFFNTTNHGGKPMWVYENVNVNFTSLAISENGSYIVAGDTDAEGIALFNITGDMVWNAYMPSTPPISVDISEDGKFIVVGGKSGLGGFVAVFDNSLPAAGPGMDKMTLNEIEWYYNPGGLVTSVAISADGNYVVVGTVYNSDDVVFFFNMTDYTYQSVLQPMWKVDAQEPISSVGISSNGSTIVAGTSTGVGYLYNSTKPGSGQDKLPIWYINYSSESFLSTDISRDGKYAVFGRDSGTVDVYDKSFDSFNDNKTDEYLWLYDAEGEVNSVAISGNGKYIVAGTNYNPNTGDDDENTIFLFENADYNVGAINDPEWVFNTSYDVHSVSISRYGTYIAAGGKYNPIIDWGRAFLFYHESIYPPGEFTLDSNAGDPDKDGNFNLTWTKSAGADNYSVYSHDVYIHQIKNNGTLEDQGIEELNYTISGLISGDYYYMVIAYNETGNTSSNCLQVSVRIPPKAFNMFTDADDPDTDGNFNLTWSKSIGADNYSVYRSNNPISNLDSCIEVKSNITDLNYTVSGISSGTHYFVIVAYNLTGFTLSNYVRVNISITPSGLPPAQDGNDDDDDDKAEINLLLIGIVISCISAGVVVAIITICLKKRKR